MKINVLKERLRSALPRTLKEKLKKLFLRGQKIPEKNFIWSLNTLRDIVHIQASKELQYFLDSGRFLNLQCKETPIVSIVIPVRNRCELTYQCLLTLKNSANEMPFEAIVIDNDSSDQSGELFKKLLGVTVIRNQLPFHYLESCNQGAKLAKGEFLLLLNNDTKLHPGSIGAAITRLQKDATIGMVGGKLILPDGSLQEGGAYVLKDGTCVGYGRGFDPKEASINFARPVDFCSGAFLVTRSSLFAKLGGFDPAYKPAYFEEVDYAFRLWEQGLKVFYDPKIVVSHFEFASEETPGKSVELMLERQKIFASRHSETLKNRPLVKDDGDLLHLRRIAKRKVLYIDERLPIPHYGAGYPRALALVKALHELNFFVAVAAPLYHDPDLNWGKIYSLLPEDLYVMPQGLLNEDFQSRLKKEINFYDIIIVSRPTTMREVLHLLPKSKVIYDAESLFPIREKLEAKFLNKIIDEGLYEQALKDEIALTEGVKSVIAVSPNEAKIFQQYGVKHVNVLSHAVPKVLVNFSEKIKGQDILFVGPMLGDGGPNYDSMVWFCEEILPLLRQKGVNNVIKIAGVNHSTGLKKFMRLGVEILGRVDNLERCYHEARVFIAPTRFAAGIPLKVLEAGAHGVPMVISPLLAEQLGWTEEEVLIGKNSEDFAEKVTALIREDKLWSGLAESVQQKVQKEYSAEIFMENLKKALHLRSPL